MRTFFLALSLFFCSTALSLAQPLPEYAVEPLLKTVRVQTAPYNRSCPYYNYGDSVSSEPCLVGCVATALEQLLSYYRYPEVLLDSIAGWETPNYSLATVPAGSVIDWDDVADLSLWCGMMVQMKYGPTASASGLWKAEEPLRRVFGYKTVRILDRSLYSFDAWHRILQNELLAGRPVAYVGYNNTLRGHAFNIDGVNEDGLYHCNWGEGEHQNGYFSLEHLCQMQPHWDATDWGRMVGYNANEYMLLLHPDSVADVLEPDTLADFANSVQVDDIVFSRPVTAKDYVLTDVTLTNISSDTLFQTYEIILNSPSDTSLLEQCKEVAISAVKLLPGETRTQSVLAHYPVVAGDWVVGVTFDGREVPYTKQIKAEASVPDDLSCEFTGISFGDGGTAFVGFRMQNAAREGISGKLLYCRLFKDADDVACSADYRVLSLPAGNSVLDTLCFHRLESGQAYRVEITGWAGGLATVSFVVPDVQSGVQEPLPDCMLERDRGIYDLTGKPRRRQGSGMFIMNGRKFYGEY